MPRKPKAKAEAIADAVEPAAPVAVAEPEAPAAPAEPSKDLSDPQIELALADTTPELTQQRVVNARALNAGRKQIKSLGNRLKKLVVEEFKPTQLMANEWNPNRQSDHDFELLLRSMEINGFTQPVIALKGQDGPNGEHIIVDGEHRWRAGITLGYDTIPVVLVDMTIEQAKIATISHNRARGSHNIELEADILKDLQEAGFIDFAQQALDIDDTELNKMLNDIAAPEALADTTYTEAWAPEDFTDAERAALAGGQQTAEGREENLSGQGKIMRGMTVAAVEKAREREELIARAKNAQDRKAAQEQSYMYRVSLVFSGDEGHIVKKALGDQPAEMLLQLCQEHVAEMERETPEGESQTDMKAEVAETPEPAEA